MFPESITLQVNPELMPENNKTFKVKVNDFIFSFDQKEIDDADFIKISSEEFNLIRNSRTVNAKLSDADDTGKNLSLEIDGEVFYITIKIGRAHV